MRAIVVFVMLTGAVECLKGHRMGHTQYLPGGLGQAKCTLTDWGQRLGHLHQSNNGPPLSEFTNPVKAHVKAVWS